MSNPDHAALVERLKKIVAHVEQADAEIPNGCTYGTIHIDDLTDAIAALELGARVNAGHIALIESQSAALSANSTPARDLAKLAEIILEYFEVCPRGEWDMEYLTELLGDAPVFTPAPKQDTPAPSEHPTDGGKAVPEWMMKATSEVVALVAKWTADDNATNDVYKDALALLARHCPVGCAAPMGDGALRELNNACAELSAYLGTEDRFPHEEIVAVGKRVERAVHALTVPTGSVKEGTK